MQGYNRAGNLKRITTHARRTTRHKEAIVRNLAWAALTTEAKLRMLDSRPGESKKQRAKLTKVV